MKKVKILLKGIIFLSILAFLLTGLSWIVKPKDNTKNAGMRQVSANGILSEKENTIDMLVIGDSESYSSISPMQMWQEHGITSYVCGTPRQTLYESYRFLLKALKTQKPQIVLLETNSFFRKYTLSQHIQFKGEDLFPIFEYHNRWKSLKSNDFQFETHYTWHETMKGFRYNTDIKSSESKDYKKKTKDMKKISLWNLYYFHKINDLCQKNDIKLMLLSTPSTKNWNYAKHNRLQQLAKEENIEYIDLNLVNQISIDWSKDTRDKGDHLNYSGAKKVTKYLGLYFAKKGLLKNHKNESYYSKWNEDLIKYNKKVHN